MKARIPLYVANWKMNKGIAEAHEYIEKLKAFIKEWADTPCGVVIAPSAVHLVECKKWLDGSKLELGAQNCGIARFGAFTGENSPAVLKEIGCSWVILGHSERRHVFKEDDYLISLRVKSALDENLNVILCVGEVLQDRKAGSTFKVIQNQLSILKAEKLPSGFFAKLVIAYEPVWAIGTGENASPEQVSEVHAFIRNWFVEKISPETGEQIRILYGGSVKPENSGLISAKPNVDGLLVGTASLDPVVFAGVIRSALQFTKGKEN